MLYGQTELDQTGSTFKEVKMTTAHSIVLGYIIIMILLMIVLAKVGDK